MPARIARTTTRSVFHQRACNRACAQNGAGGQTRLLRTPTVSATQIAFAYANNIWIVPRIGGSTTNNQLPGANREATVFS